MKVAYFDCFSGVSGDMILGAMLDAGLDPSHLRRAIAQLHLPGCALKISSVRRQGLAATHVEVRNPRRHAPLANLSRIRVHLRQSGLPHAVQTQSLRIFTRLAQAEAQAHGVKTGRAHFHEVGEVDTLVDVVGAVVGLSLLKIDRVVASPIHVGSGTVQTAHGTLPIPPPATACLLKGCPIYATGVAGELTTPTGAAILSTLAESFAPLPMMTIAAVGHGAGRAEREIPNLLRLWIGTTPEDAMSDEVAQIETQIDDMNPQIYEHVFERLFEAGALDVFLTQIIMKRGRPGILLTVLAAPALQEKMTQVLFAETTTLGVRVQRLARRILTRKIRVSNTPEGPVRIKTAYQDGRILRARPEFRDVKKIAEVTARPLRSLLDQKRRRP